MVANIPHHLRQLPQWASLSPFSMAVLAAVYSIPRGQTRTYKQVAKMAASLSGRPSHARAYRAVGSVMRKNPYAPLVPCHRVIKSDGCVGNYSGRGGIRTKMLLLEKEKNKRKREKTK